MPLDHSSKWTPTLQTSAVRPTDTSLTSRSLPRRNGHGGNAWSMPFGDQIQRQPQDGATQRLNRLTSIASRLTSSLPQEPEDARLTGGTRSLSRRLLGLNITMTQRKSPDVVDLRLKAQVA